MFAVMVVSVGGMTIDSRSAFELWERRRQKYIILTSNKAIVRRSARKGSAIGIFVDKAHDSLLTRTAFFVRGTKKFAAIHS
jgi:hypothetical protein